MNDRPPELFSIGLCSMPWAIFNRPSIQLASLASYISQKSTYNVDCFHPYLDIAALLGRDLYPEIAHSGWAGEALFAPLVYPEKVGDAADLFNRSLSQASRKKVTFSSLVMQIDEACQSWLEHLDLSEYTLFGFSICFSQLLPSVYMAKLLKEKHPTLPVVFGGSSCCGTIGTSLLQEYEQLDYVIDGEGEERLLALSRFLDGKTSTLADGISERKPRPASVQIIEPVEMETLPLPDYSSYIKEMKQSFVSQPFIPLLPIEFSRGCWWNRCSFCNLNIQWPGYRCKSGRKMVEEVTALSQRYESLHFTFTDNALPPREADYFFSEIAKKAIDYNFFAEIRATGNSEKLKTYRRGGLTTVQVGIEALSTSLLKKMAKGSTSMDNIAMMKLCAEQGITMEGNLIVDFPATSIGEIDETTTNLAYVLPFAPLEAAAFFLGYGSPIYKNLKHYSIQSLTPHAKTKLLFPEKCHNSMTMLISGYRGDKSIQQKRWRSVKQKIDAWRAFHKARVDKSIPALSYRDGENFLIIRQEQATGTTLHHRLRGLSRKIYLAAPIPTAVSSIQEQFSQVSADALKNFIDDMCSKHLMFQESGQVLSLALQRY